MKHKIEVFNKTDVFDGTSYNLKKDILDLGVKSLKDAKVSYLYLFDGELNLGQIENVCKNILVDPVTQDYRIITDTNKIHKNSDEINIEVWYKSGVTDAVGETTQIGIKDLGIKGDFSVKTGMKYTLKGVSMKEADLICNRILANKVVQFYKIL